MMMKQDQDPARLHSTHGPSKSDARRIGGGDHDDDDHHQSPIVQFKGPVVLIASPCGVLQFWRIGESTTGTSLGCIAQPRMIYQHPVQGNRLVDGGDTNTTESFQITCLAMDTSSDKSCHHSQQQRVMVGYHSGHFSILEYTLQDTMKDQDDTEGSIEALSVHTVGCTTDLPAWSDVGRIESAAFHYPILTTCTDDGAISIYHLEAGSTTTTAVGPRHWCRLLHRLYGSSPESPIGISLEEIKPLSDTLSDSGSGGGGAWKALVSFGLELYNGSWTMRLQEIDFDEYHILHSTEIGALDDDSHVDEGYASPMSGLEPFGCGKASGYAEIGLVSAVSISWPLVVTAHRDNTLNVFQMTRDMGMDEAQQQQQQQYSGTTRQQRKGELAFRHLSTLYGHCGAVSSVSIESGRLVSASMDRSIKIWTVAGNHHHGGGGGGQEKSSIHRCSVSLSDINKSWTESGQVTKEEGSGLMWVGSDEEKIVSMNCDGTVKVWQFS